MSFQIRMVLVLVGSLYSMCAFSQVISQYNTIASTGETIVHRTVTIKDPSTGKPTIVHQAMRKNPDGSLSVIHSLMTPKLKRIHQEICAKHGGKLNTKANITIMPQSMDGFICSYPPKVAPKKGAKATPKKGVKNVRPQSGYVLIISSPGIIYATRGQNFTLKSVYSYIYDGLTPYSKSLSVDKCGISESGQVGFDGSSGKGQGEIFVLCYEGPDNPVGTTYISIAQACVGGNCRSAYGKVIAK